jgi:hypothetical protein
LSFIKVFRFVIYLPATTTSRMRVRGDDAHREVTPGLTRMSWPAANETGAAMSIQAAMPPPGGRETIPVVNATLRTAMGPPTNVNIQPVG